MKWSLIYPLNYWENGCLKFLSFLLLGLNRVLFFFFYPQNQVLNKPQNLCLTMKNIRTCCLSRCLMAYFLNDMISHILSIYNWNRLNLFHQANFNKIYQAPYPFALIVCIFNFFLLSVYSSVSCPLCTFTVSVPM